MDITGRQFTGEGGLHALRRAFVEYDDPQCGYCTPVLNVLGVKDLGELPATGVAPVIAALHATGRRIRDLPILPEMLI